MTRLRRLVSVSMAREFSTFLIPGPDIARAHGLDIAAAGIQLSASPRHASALLVIGAVPPAMLKAAVVVYAQMMRPRAIFVLGAEDISPLPSADIATGLSQQDLIEGMHQLRTLFAEGAFRPDMSDFDAPVLQTRIEYTCPMHPEVVQSEPGSCPKCGMTLMPRQAQATTGHNHTNHKEVDATANEQTVSSHDHKHHHSMAHDAPTKYTCPMHPEVVQSEPGSCPKCGMTLVPREALATQTHELADMDHGSMDHGAMAFMSMIDVTQDLPRSIDGLPMEWIEVPFGPFFPGLPGGLLLMLTLDGDTVAASDAHTLIENNDFPSGEPMDIASFAEHLTGMDPLVPVSYRLLACRALENAAQVDVFADIARARIGAQERERIASHLGWLALFGRQTGFDWLMRRAASLQLKVQNADFQQVVALRPEITVLMKRLHWTPLLKSRTVGIGRLVSDAKLRGPVARASGICEDARSKDKIYEMLGFTSAVGQGGDAFSRLHVRLEEIFHSLALIEAAGAIALPVPATIGNESGKGEAVVESPRGMARLELTLENGRVSAAQLDTPSTHHLTLIDQLTEQQELADALLAVGSLDLSPWEIQQ